MKKLLLAGAVALSMTGAGCGTVTNAIGITESKIAEVQRLADTICGFVVAADSVSALFGTGAYTAISLAQGICAVVTKSTRTRTLGAGPAPALNGIPIVGHFRNR